MTPTSPSNQTGFSKIIFISLLIIISVVACLIYFQFGSSGLDESRTEVWSSKHTVSTTAKSEASSNITEISEAGISLNITLSNELAARVKPNDALFIYVKAVDGPRFPLAVKRMRVSDLPLNITLSDADAMMPAAKISDFTKYRVGARISFAGNAIASPGDLFGEKDLTAPVSTVEIQINTVKQ